MMQHSKIIIYVAVILNIFARCYGDMVIYTNEQLTKSSGLIVDGVITDKKLILDEVLTAENGVQFFTEKYEYKFKVLEVIRGEEYLNSEVINMVQLITYDEVRFKEKSYEVGEQLRFFKNRGKFENGKFIPFSKSTDQRMRSFKYNFSLSPTTARADLFGQPIDVEVKEKEEKIPENIAPKKPVVKPSTDGNATEDENTTENEEKSFLIWWILFGVVILLIGLFLIARSKIKS